jgi:hypothetical protein
MERKKRIPSLDGRVGTPQGDRQTCFSFQPLRSYPPFYFVEKTAAAPRSLSLLPGNRLFEPQAQQMVYCQGKSHSSGSRQLVKETLLMPRPICLYGPGRVSLPLPPIAPGFFAIRAPGAHLASSPSSPGALFKNHGHRATRGPAGSQTGKPFHAASARAKVLLSHWDCGAGQGGPKPSPGGGEE